MNRILKIVSRIVKFIQFFFYVFWEVIISNIRVAYDVITPGSRARPGVIAIPLDCKSAIEITWLANIISLTPGTLILDISSDRKILFMHAMFIDDIEKLKKSVKDKFEKPILELFE